MLRLKKLRKEKQVNQLKIAMDLQISQASISKYESGSSEPDIAMIIRIAKYFNVSTDYLLGNSEAKSTLPIEELSEHELDNLLSYKDLSHLPKEKLKAYVKGILDFLM